MKMKVEESGSIDKEKGQFPREKEERLWNARKISSFQKTKEKELLRLKFERPSKDINPQYYFNYRSMKEQIKYELDIRQ